MAAPMNKVERPTPQLSHALRHIRQRLDSALDRIGAMNDRFSSSPKEVGEPVSAGEIRSDPTYEVQLQRIEGQVSQLHEHLDTLEGRI